MLFVKKVVDTAKTYRQIMKLKKSRKIGVNAIMNYDCSDIVHEMLLEGTVLFDNDIADGYRTIKELWA